VCLDEKRIFAALKREKYMKDPHKKIKMNK